MPAVAAQTQASTGRYAIPRLRRGALRRARLLNQLHDGIGNGLIVVQAPAGYGKSSLLAQFATELDYRICWLTLDASSNVPEVLADQLASAIRQEERQEAMAAPVSRPEDLRVHVMSAVVGAVEVRTSPSSSSSTTCTSWPPAKPLVFSTG